MKITHIDSYLDGGTMKIETESQTYYIDDRINTYTKGKVYKGYPGDEGSNTVLDQKAAKTEILRALDKYHSATFDWKPAIYDLFGIVKVTLEVTMDKESADNMMGAYDCNDIETSIRTHMDEINEMDGINITTKVI